MREKCQKTGAGRYGAGASYPDALAALYRVKPALTYVILPTQTETLMLSDVGTNGDLQPANAGAKLALTEFL